jgi:hypothetical protein
VAILPCHRCSARSTPERLKLLLLVDIALVDSFLSFLRHAEDRSHKGPGGSVKKLIVAVLSVRVGWDGTWIGGWGKGAGVQLIFAGETLIGFYFRDDYKELLRSTVTAEGGRTFSWDKVEVSLTRTPNGGTLLVVHERGKPEVSIR